MSKGEKKLLFDHLWWVLKDNFPDDTIRELDLKYRSLIHNDYGEEDLELYVPKFHGIVLRVGIKCKNNDKKSFFSTSAEYELAKLLN